MSPELNQLIELQELDLEIQHISDRLSKIPEEREKTENEFKQHAAEFLGARVLQGERPGGHVCAI